MGIPRHVWVLTRTFRFAILTATCASGIVMLQRDFFGSEVHAAALRTLALRGHPLIAALITKWRKFGPFGDAKGEVLAVIRPGDRKADSAATPSLAAARLSVGLFVADCLMLEAKRPREWLASQGHPSPDGTGQRGLHRGHRPSQ